MSQENRADIYKEDEESQRGNKKEEDDDMKFYVKWSDNAACYFLFCLSLPTTITFWILTT